MIRKSQNKLSLVELSTYFSITILFIVWASFFILRTSYVHIDGQRYFCLFDDAMIAMRYAWNYSHSQGLVWNSGEYIQGYTNMLMVLVMSIGTFLFSKSGAVLSVQVFGVIITIINATLASLISRQIFRQFIEDYKAIKFLSLFVFVGTISYYPLLYWSLMGMETSLLAFLLLFSVLLFVKFLNTDNPILLIWMSILLGLAFTTRMDSIIYTGLIYLYLFIDALQQKRIRHPLHLIVSLIIIVLIISGQLLFQKYYYGQWLPNTYTLKLTGLPLLHRIRNGLDFITPFIKYSSFILILSILDLITNFKKITLLLMSFLLVSLLYQIYVGGEAWNYWRIMTPTIPLLIIVFSYAIYGVVNILISSESLSKYFTRNPILFRNNNSAAPLVIIFFIGIMSINSQFFKEASLLWLPYQTLPNHQNVKTALAINELTTPDASVGVFWGGTIPYYSDRKAYDFLGKSDKYIASLPGDRTLNDRGVNFAPGHVKYDLNYSIKGFKPTYVQSFIWGPQNLTGWADTLYTQIEYNKTQIYLLKDSPHVLWDKIVE